MKPILVCICFLHMHTSDSSGDSDLWQLADVIYTDVPLALRPTVSDGLP